MLRVCRTNELIVVDVHQRPQLLNPAHDIIHIGLGGDASFFGLILDLLTMLISACEHIGIVAQLLFKPGDGIRRHRGIGMTDM